MEEPKIISREDLDKEMQTARSVLAPPTWKQRMFSIGGNVALILVMISFILTVYWSNKQYDVLVFKTEPIPISGHDIHAGDFVTVRFDYCKNYPAPEIRIQRWISNNITRMELPYGTVNDTPNTAEIKQPVVNTPVGCYPSDQATPTPLHAAPGTYHYEWEVDYQVNPIKVVTVRFKSVDFEIK